MVDTPLVNSTNNKKPAVTTTEEQTVGPRTDAGFSFKKFTDLWSRGDELRTQRQEAERAALENTQDANEQIYQLQDKSLQTKQGFVEGIRPLVDELKTVEAARQRQTQLQSSGSLVDQLQAMQDAMLNPRLATTSGRAKMRAELNASLSTLATVNAAEQDVIASQMDLVKLGLGVKNAKYDQTKLLEAQHLEVLQAEQARVDAIYKGLLTNQSARELVLNDMSRDELVKAKESAVKTGGVEVNGFQLPAHIIDQQIAKVDNMAFDMQVKRLALENRNDQLEERAMNRVALQLTKTQIQSLIQGGQVRVQTPDGPQELNSTDFKTHILKQALDLKTQVESDQIKASADAVLYGDLGQETIVPGLQKWDTLRKKLPPGSEAQKLAEKRRAEYVMIGKELEAGRKILGENPNPEQLQFFNRTTAMWGEKLANQANEDDQIIAKQALKDARGDKELASIYESTYRGQPVDEAVVRNLAQKRLVENKDFTDVLPPQMVKSAQKIYSDKLAAARAKNQFTDDGINDKERKQIIAQESIEQAAVENARPYTDRFLGAQTELLNTRDPDLQSNPISQLRDVNGDKIFTPERFLSVIKQSDVQAEIMMNNDPALAWLTPDLRVQLRNGQPVTGPDGQQMDPASFQQLARPYQDTAFLIALDEQQAGLADRYVKWWEENGAKYADSFTSSEYEATLQQGNAQNNSMQTLTSLVVERSIDNYKQGIVTSHSMFREEQQKRRRNWISYDQDPANRQAALLQFNPELSDQEKTLVFRQFIRPIVLNGAKANMPYEDVNIAVEEAFANPERIPGFKENAALKKVVAKVQQNRGEIVKQLEALTDSPWLQGNDKKVSQSVLDRISKENLSGGISLPGGSMPQNFFDIPKLFSGENVPRQKLGDPITLMNPGARTGITDDVPGWLKRETGTRPYDWYRNLISAPETDPNGGM